MLPCGWPLNISSSPLRSKSQSGLSFLRVYYCFQFLVDYGWDECLWYFWCYGQYVIKKHIERVIYKKEPDDRKVIGSLDVNDYVVLYILISSVNRKSITFLVTFRGNDTKSIWQSTTSLPCEWTSLCDMRDYEHIQSLLN